MLRYASFALLFAACTTPPPPPSPVVPSATTEIRDDLRALYDPLHVTGSFIGYDAGKDRWTFIDSAQADVGTLPASTFKIFSSLYGLESGVIADTGFVIPWDGTDHGRPALNQDLSLRGAYDVSAYWYHREIARRAGPAVLKHWLDTVGYGNADTSGGFDRCWVEGGLRITPREQIAFLQRLQRSELPFSARSTDLVRTMMVREDTLGHVLRAKTGWAQDASGDMGWFVGWVEAPGKGPYFFANRIFNTDTSNTAFGEARKTIALDVLRAQGMWP